VHSFIVQDSCLYFDKGALDYSKKETVHLVYYGAILRAMWVCEP